jgi:hypothetical protein
MMSAEMNSQLAKRTLDLARVRKGYCWPLFAQYLYNLQNLPCVGIRQLLEEIFHRASPILLLEEVDPPRHILNDISDTIFQQDHFFREIMEG